jgi:tRNA(Ile)-lysidine synthase
MVPPFFQTLNRFIRQFGLLKPGDSVLLAVSGGPDSVALLHLFHEYLQHRYKLKISIAHLNHGVRGRSADRDQRFVQALGKSLGYRVVTKKVRLKKRRGESLEDRMRKVRYDFLEKTARKRGLRRIATGHHLDDQAETVLMRLLSGCGQDGLMGIRPLNGRIIRPLLPVPKATLLHFLKTRGAAFCVDKSNRSGAFARTCVRLRLLPYLKRHFGRAVTGILARAARNAFTAGTLPRPFVRTLLAGLMVSSSRARRVLDARRLEACPDNILKRVLEEALRPFGAGTLTARHVDDVRHNVLLAGTGGAVSLKNRVEITRSYHHVIIRKKTGPVKTPKTIMIPKKPGLYSLGPGQGRVRLSRLKPSSRPPFPPAHGPRAFLDEKAIGAQISVRPRRAGDRFHPLGAPGRMKLKAFLINEKVPRGVRDSLRVFVSKTGIFWVSGLRIAEPAKVTEKTRKILVVEIVN